MKKRRKSINELGWHKEIIAVPKDKLMSLHYEPITGKVEVWWKD